MTEKIKWRYFFGGTGVLAGSNNEFNIIFWAFFFAFLGILTGSALVDVVDVFFIR